MDEVDVLRMMATTIRDPDETAVESDARQRLISHRPPRAPRRIGRRVVLTALSAVLIFSGGFATANILDDGAGVDAPAEQKIPFVGSMFDPQTIDPTNPNDPLLIGGKQVSLPEAERFVGFPLYRPDAPEASDASLAQVWVGAEATSGAAIRYQSGLRVYVTPWPQGKSPEESYREQVVQNGAGALQTINGNIAYVVPEDAKGPDNPPWGVVDVVIGNVEVSLQGQFPVEDVARIAGTLSPTMVG